MEINRDYINEFIQAYLTFGNNLFGLGIYIKEITLKNDEGANKELVDFLKTEFNGVISSQPLVKGKFDGS